MNPDEFLLDWAYHYANHKAVFRGENDKVSKSGGRVEVKGEKQSFLYIPLVDLGDFSEKEPGKDQTIQIITFNTKENLATLIKKWSQFSKFRNVLVMFINPFSKLDKSWSIHPFIHNRICDEKALGSGLKSLFLAVDAYKRTDDSRLKI